MVLAERAAAGGQSLQMFLLALVTAEAGRSTNVALLARFTGRSDGSRVSGADTTADIDRARAEGDAIIAGAPDQSG